MMVFTAKINKKKLLALAAAAVLLLAAAVYLFSGSKDAVTTGAASAASNSQRVAFLESFGWEVDPSPLESGQVRIPAGEDRVFLRYNQLQKQQGYDLTRFSGKLVMRYVYEIKNLPDTDAPVYATLLIHKNQIIGGDITGTAADGRIRGFQKSEDPLQEPTGQS